MTAKDKAILNKIHDKHYGNKTTKTLATKTPETPATTAPETRAALMQRAKEKGIPYFRILNRQELTLILEMKRSGATDEQMKDQVITPAVARWKAGWGATKQQAQEVAA